MASRRSSSSSSSSTSSSSTQSTTRDDRSTIRTDGGTVTVQRRNSTLEVVDVMTADGWRADDTSDEQTIVVAFSRPGARVDVTIRLSATGITSSVSSATS